MKQLSLLVPYRDRLDHLRSQLRWWQHWQAMHGTETVEYVVIEWGTTVAMGTVETMVRAAGGRYLGVSGAGVFPKARLLNLGLRATQGRWIAPLDVDLIPVGTTLEQHLSLAQSFGLGLVTGYRLMSPLASLPSGDYATAVKSAREGAYLGPEDQPSALWKHLTRGERFGVLPLFERERLVAVGGWDEQFVGWGAEDQELLERYLQGGNGAVSTTPESLENIPILSLTRCPDLVYLHLHHEPSSDWAEDHWVSQNRAYYYALCQERDLNS